MKRSSKRNLSELETDEAKALQLAMLINDIRETASLRQLRYTRQVLSEIKKTPKITPSAKQLKLTEIAPELQREESEQFQPETGTPPQSWFERLRRRLRRGKGAT